MIKVCLELWLFAFFFKVDLASNVLGLLLCECVSLLLGLLDFVEVDWHGPQVALLSNFLTIRFRRRPVRTVDELLTAEEHADCVASFTAHHSRLDIDKSLRTVNYGHTAPMLEIVEVGGWTFFTFSASGEDDVFHLFILYHGWNYIQLVRETSTRS